MRILGKPSNPVTAHKSPSVQVESKQISQVKTAALGALFVLGATQSGKSAYALAGKLYDCGVNRKQIQRAKELTASGDQVKNKEAFLEGAAAAMGISRDELTNRAAKEVPAASWKTMAPDLGKFAVSAGITTFAVTSIFGRKSKA